MLIIDKKLRKRLRRLEEAVLQLQDKVFQLEHQSPIVSKPFVCILETKIHGTFMSRDRSRLGAQGKVFKKCEKKAGQYWCKKDLISCDNEV